MSKISVQPGHDGYVASAVLRLVLLFIVLAELCFLASRYRARVDLTSDQLYTLTASTQKVLSKLEDRVLIEAYFSPKQNLPILDQPKRTALVNLLEEYEKLSGGSVKVQFIDPLEDKTKRETAARLGMQPKHARVQSAGGVTAMDIWQGIRIRYGAEKQQVIPYMPFPPRGQHSTAFYEKALTPTIKQLSVKEKIKIGILSFQSRPGGGGMSLSMEERTPPQGYVHLARVFSREFDVQPIDISKGQLIPEDVRVALMIRPKYLTDRTKFVFDQYLMRGGNLVIFADTAELEVRKDRTLRGSVVSYDAPTAKLRFLDMLKTYGVEVRNQVVGEGVSELQQPFFEQQTDRNSSQQISVPIRYPYFFEAHNNDWKKFARAMAKNSKGEVDAAMAAQYESRVLPGINTDHEFMKAIAGMGAPGFFWPCPVDLVQPLPAGLEGDVLLRTSPLAWVEAPNAPLDPFQEAGEFRQRRVNLDRWNTAQTRRIPQLPVQIPLMVHVHGKFPSYFADKPVPKTQAEKEAEKKKQAKKEAEDWGENPDKPAKKDEVLPKPAAPKEAEAKPETKIVAGLKESNLIVVGDATFLRDDFVRAQYGRPSQQYMVPVFGPFDREIQNGRPLLFMKNLFDWLSQERDLLELQNKRRTDRAMSFVERDEANQETDEEYRERLIASTSLVRWTNLLVPTFALLLFGLGVFFTRRAKKRAFLATL